MNNLARCVVGAVNNETISKNEIMAFSSDPNTFTSQGSSSNEKQVSCFSCSHETSDSNAFPVRYDIDKQVLVGGQGSKVRKLLKLKLVEMLDACHFIIHPIEGYNSTTYNVIISINEESCNCQYNKIYGKTCSHILAAKAHYNIMTGGKEL